MRSFRSSWSGMPGNGMVLPGKAFCSAIMNSSSEFFVPNNVRIFHGLAIAEPWH